MEEQRQRQDTGDNGKATVVITYNSVQGYPAGTYQGPHGPVVIHSHDNTSTWNEAAPGKLSQIMHGLYGRFSPEDTKQIYLYVGLYAKDGALRAAESLAGQGNKNLTLVACDCDSWQKQATARELGTPIIWSECGGRRTLGRLVEKALA